MGDLAEILQRLVTPAPPREWMPLDVEAKARGKTTSALREWRESAHSTLSLGFTVVPTVETGAIAVETLNVQSQRIVARDPQHRLR